MAIGLGIHIEIHFFLILFSIPYARHYKPQLVFFYPISKDHLSTVTFGLMYGLYSRAASNQERPMMARVRYAFVFHRP